MANNKKKIKAAGNLLAKPLSHFFAKKAERKKINVTISANKSARREAEEFHKSLEGMTKEEKIAANKARVAQFHPEPDFSSSNKVIYQSRKKIEFEKKMKEKGKKLWYSIVSIPMGGLKKR